MFAVASECAGTPRQWSATDERSGLVVVAAIENDDSVGAAYRRIATMVQARRRAGAIVVLSLHFGPNWAIGRRPYRRRLAHRLMDGNVADVIYGHSSHHVRGIETYRCRVKPMVYGAGNLIHDYEGFQDVGDEAYSKAGAIFLADVDSGSGRLHALRLVPTYVDRLSLLRLQDDALTWHPPSRSMRPATTIAEFAAAINRLSIKDSGGGGGQPLTLTAVRDDADVPGGPVLLYSPMTNAA